MIKKENNFEEYFGLKLPIWIIEEFKKLNYYPKNYSEASHFLSDAVLEINKVQSYTIKFKDKNEEREIVLSKNNSQFAFYSKIWEKLDKKMKANCILWFTKKFAKMTMNLKTDVNFIPLLESNNLEFGAAYTQFKETCFDINRIYVNLNNDPYSILNIIFHELTHMKQNIKLNYITEKKIKSLTQNQIFLLEPSYNNFFDQKLNSLIYWINPKEVEARKKANKYTKQVLEVFKTTFDDVETDFKFVKEKLSKEKEIDDIADFNFNHKQVEVNNLVAEIFKSKMLINYFQENKTAFFLEIEKNKTKIENLKQKIQKIYNESQNKQTNSL